MALRPVSIETTSTAPTLVYSTFTLDQYTLSRFFFGDTVERFRPDLRPYKAL